MNDELRNEMFEDLISKLVDKNILNSETIHDVLDAIEVAYQLTED